jgi:hypothetical protein
MVKQDIRWDKDNKTNMKKNMKKTDIEFCVRLLVMIISLMASFITKDFIESQFLISLSIMSGLSLIRQISDHNEITIKNGK